ncbi:MAG: hypothetical protein M3065_13245 [Actinomycetota bacterium]|nr:hypothetical protein [Actinomycetota bacterium]
MIESYLRQVEPVRLAVNRLLAGADPILHAYQDGSVSPARSARRMGRFAQRFAGYTTDIAAITPAPVDLRHHRLAYGPDGHRPSRRGGATGRPAAGRPR